MQLNALHYPQISQDAKTQVQHNVPRRAFYQNRTEPTRALKIVGQRFVPRTHWNAQRNMEIQPNAKRQVRRNFDALIMETARGPPEHEK
jgi:hypothetical protein